MFFKFLREKVIPHLKPIPYTDKDVFDYIERNIAPKIRPVTSVYEKITKPFIYRHDSLIHRIFLPFAIVFFLYMASVSIKWWIMAFSR